MRRAALLLATLMALGASSCATQTDPGTMEPPEAIYVDPALAGWNVAALGELEAWAGANNTGHLVIVDAERIVFERFWPIGYDNATLSDPHRLAQLGQKVLDGDAVSRAQFAPVSIAGAPDDLQVFRSGQYAVYVSQARSLIVVRTGRRTTEADVDQALWSLIAKAVPAAKQ